MLHLFWQGLSKAKLYRVRDPGLDCHHGVGARSLVVATTADATIVNLGGQVTVSDLSGQGTVI